MACILTFGLITPYMFLPVGFGKIYLNTVLIGNLNANGLAVDPALAPKAMLIPALGMVAGLLIAVFLSYRKPRDYKTCMTKQAVLSQEPVEIKMRNVVVGVIAIAVALAGQLWLDSLVIASVAAILVFVIARTIHLKDTQDVFTHGVYLMGGIGIVMIAAKRFCRGHESHGKCGYACQDGLGLDRQLPQSGGLSDAPDRTRHHNGNRLLVLNGSPDRGDLRAALHETRHFAAGDRINRRRRRSSRRCGSASLGIGSRTDSRTQCGWSARPYLRLHDPDFHSLQYPLLIAGWIAGMVL